jgi:SAM-dependent methyltransferase
MGRIRSQVGSKLRAVGVLGNDSFTPTQQAQLHEIVAGLDARLDTIEKTTSGHALDILDEYCKEAPSPQTAVDVFAGEWASRFPEPFTHLVAGGAPLFAAEHVAWGIDALGGVDGQRVVELGPLEGGHTFMLDRRGAREVVAVEANTRAFLKCLVTKEILGIPSARFLCGDALRYLEGNLARGGEKFDLCLASGVLYHFVNPVAALELMTKSSDRLLLWSMYYDDEYIQSREDLAIKFPSSTPMEHAGFKHTLYRQEYREALAYKGFCGGSAASSAWMTKDDIFGAVEHFGFEILETGFEEQNHKGNGPCISLVARRK